MPVHSAQALAFALSFSPLCFFEGVSVLSRVADASVGCAVEVEVEVKAASESMPPSQGERDFRFFGLA